MQCKQCGAQFEGKFCPQCGAPAEEKMSVCPVCGKARSGEDRFCSECGYDFEKKPSAAASAQTSVSAPAAAPQRSAAVARKPFPKKQVLTAVAVVAVIAILLAILIPTISFFTNKFRIGVVEQINLGDSREQVLDLLGEPYDYKEGSSFFEYYSDNYRKLLEQNDSFNPDDIQNWEDFGDAFDEALELEQKLQTEEYQYIAVTFDSEGGVSSVFLDTARSEQNTEKKVLKSCSALAEQVAANQSEEIYVVEELPYEAEYTDGSYYMGFTEATAGDTGTGSIVHWSDRYGNECSARTEVILNPSGEGWYFETLEGVLHITSDQESYYFPEKVRESEIKEVEFGADVTVIEGLGISKENLNKVTVSSDNPRFYVAGNCVISSQDGQLVFGCNNSVIPSDGSVTSIGEKAFSNCDGITSVAIPDSVTSIGAKAFYDCDGITSVTIPDSVTSIGDSAFSQCPIESAIIPTLAIDFNPQGNLKSVIITNGTSIGRSAFSGCGSLTSITIPDSVTSIGEFAFSGCTSLTSITIPDSVTSIERHVFADCNSLAIITIPDGVTSIGPNAFSDCVSLTSITIPDSVTSIESSAFSGCNGVCEVENGVTYVDRWAVDCAENLTNVSLRSDTVGIANNLFEYCTSLTSIEIPESVIFIGYEAFAGCDSLTSIMIPGSVTSIGSSAFEGCSGLTSVTIGDGVTSIEFEAFAGCDSLTSITIPSSVTSIGYWAFYWCDSLTSVMFENPNGWRAGGEMIPTADLSNPATAAQYLKSSHYEFATWTRE